MIAICNDLYVPALRPLRAAAKILHFSQPHVRPVASPQSGSACLDLDLVVMCCRVPAVSSSDELPWQLSMWETQNLLHMHGACL